MREHFTDDELGDWWLYYQCDPWGEQRADFRAFMASCAPYAKDVTPKWPYVEEPFSPEELRAARETE